MLFALGVVALVVVVIGVIAAMALARRQSADDAPPNSVPADFVAPVSSGAFRFRQVDETAEQFKARIADENEEIASSKRNPTP